MAFPKLAVPVFKWGLEAKSYTDVSDYDMPTLLGPAIVYADITAQIDSGGNTPLTQGPTRGLICDKAGTLTGHDAFGNVVTTMTLQAGYNAVCIAGITSIATITQVIGVW
jgi:hypothetical protein